MTNYRDELIVVLWAMTKRRSRRLVLKQQCNGLAVIGGDPMFRKTMDVSASAACSIAVPGPFGFPRLARYPIGKDLCVVRKSGSFRIRRLHEEVVLLRHAAAKNDVSWFVSARWNRKHSFSRDRHRS